MKLPITHENVREWFPAPHVENPFAAEPWWQIQQLGLLAALQYLRLIPEGDFQQQALVELRRSIDTALLSVPQPPDEEVNRRMAQTLAPWCPSPVVVVEAMLRLGDVGPGDYLVDLGSGDGRIVFAAARRGAVATGIEIDGRFVLECRERLTMEPDGVVATFEQGDILEADLSHATVITCYLLSSSMEALREKFAQLRPGTRIISHAFLMEGWLPTKSVIVGESAVHLWVVPHNG